MRSLKASLSIRPGSNSGTSASSWGNPPLHAQRLVDHIATAAVRVVPTWPLDQFFAVNPC